MFGVAIVDRGSRYSVDGMRTRHVLRVDPLCGRDPMDAIVGNLGTEVKTKPPCGPG